MSRKIFKVFVMTQITEEARIWLTFVFVCFQIIQNSKQCPFSLLTEALQEQFTISIYMEKENIASKLI